MELQYSEKIENLSKYTAFKFEEVGDSLTLLFTEIGEAESVQYGKFNTFCGVSFNPELGSVDEAISTINMQSFVINTVIQNLIDTGRIKLGSVYKVTLTSQKGQKYVDKKGVERKTNSKHYEVVQVTGIPDELMSALNERVEVSGVAPVQPVEENVVTLSSLQNTPSKPRI